MVSRGLPAGRGDTVGVRKLGKSSVCTPLLSRLLFSQGWPGLAQACAADRRTYSVRWSRPLQGSLQRCHNGMSPFCALG